MQRHAFTFVPPCFVMAMWIMASECMAQCSPYATPVHSPVGMNPVAMAAGDMDRDGAIDIVVSTFNPATSAKLLSVCRNTGTGVFSLGFSLAHSVDASLLVVADVDNAHGPDVLSYSYRGPLHLFLNSGNGSLTQTATPLQDQVQAVAVADMNGDGYSDVVFASDVSGASALYLRTNLQNGSFDAPELISVVPEGVVWLGLADTNSNGSTDVYCIGYGGKIYNFLNAGDGTFPIVRVLLGLSGDLRLTGLAPTLGDTNGDDIPDLCIGVFRDSPPFYFMAVLDGAGGFSTWYSPAQGVQYGSGQILDIDADGRKDLVCPANGNAFAVFRGNAIGELDPPTVYSPGLGWVGGIAVADFNDDGRADLATFDEQFDALTVLRSRASSPVVFSGPQQSIGMPGDWVQFNVVATGGTPLVYHWRRNGQMLVDSDTVSGSATSQLYFNISSPLENGDIFDCIVTNLCGTVESGPASLVVLNPCAADLDGSGQFGLGDIAVLIGSWGQSCR
ncbi:MAG TPA: FG-GAP-like repeat-containing protein [Phycisphaerales bacterium]|nr:FG-GAP-like repeat-containing protein [Phycisphaerales bacterium]